MGEFCTTLETIYKMAELTEGERPLMTQSELVQQRNIFHETLNQFITKVKYEDRVKTLLYTGQSLAELKKNMARVSDNIFPDIASDSPKLSKQIRECLARTSRKFVLD